MSHLTPPSPDTALSPGCPPPTTHLLRRKRSSANAALTSRPSILALRANTGSDAAPAAQSGGEGDAVALGIEGALAGMSVQGVDKPSEEFPSLQRLIFAHLLVTSAEDTVASPPHSAATCQVHCALFQPDLLVTSSGAVYKLGRDEWTAMRDPIERLRGLVKSRQSPPPPPSSPTGEQDLSQTQSEAPVLGETLLALAPPRRVYCTSTAAISEGVQASWLVFPPANALDMTASDITGPRKVTDLITIVVRYPEQEEAKEEADFLGAAPSQIEDVLKLDLQALAGQAESSPDEGEGKEKVLGRVLELFKA